MQPSIFPSVLIVKRGCVFACLNTSSLCLSLTPSPSAAACARSPGPVHAHPTPCTLTPALGFGDFLAIPQKGSISSLPASRCSSDGIWLVGPPLLALRPGRFAGFNPAQFLLEQLLPPTSSPTAPMGQRGVSAGEGGQGLAGASAPPPRGAPAAEAGQAGVSIPEMLALGAAPAAVS